MRTDLGEHGLAVVGDHGGLVTVQGDGGVVERFLGVLQYVVKICHAPLKNTPKVPWHQCTANG